MKTFRKDQVRNRLRLVEAALAAFVEDGAEVSLNEVARRAQVGPSTLYRNFPGRDDLVEAVLDRLAANAREQIKHLADAEDAREAFRLVIAGLCDSENPEAGAFASLAETSPRTEAYAQAIVADLVGPATERLARAGHLRHDIQVDDVVAFVRMLEGAPIESGQREKALRVLLDGLVL